MLASALEPKRSNLPHAGWPTSVLGQVKAYLKKHHPHALIAAGRVKRTVFVELSTLLGIIPAFVNTLNPKSAAEILRFRRLARAERQLRNQRVQAFNQNGCGKVMVIKMNHHTAGFIAYLSFALNQLSYCEKQGYFPVVYFGRRAGDGLNAYYDPRFGWNMWDYFFEPVAGLTYDDILSMRLERDRLTGLSSEELAYLHAGDPESVFAYPFGVWQSLAENDLDWYRSKRLKANRLIQKYVKIKKHVQQEIDGFYERQMKGEFVVGVHLRGTDKGTQPGNPRVLQIVEPEAYFEHLAPILQAQPSAKILIATDQQQYLDAFVARYGERVIRWDSIRSKTKRNAFLKNDLNGYRKGKDVIAEVQLLSRCQRFLKCASGIGEAVMWFKPDLDYLDLNYRD